MKIPRELSNTVNYILDNIVPPVIRDQRWFMAPLMRAVLGPKYKHYMEFKERLPYLTDEEIDGYYTLLADTFIKRDTDLNQKSLFFILAKLREVGGSVVDIGCGQGYLTREMLEINEVESIHGFDVAPPNDRDGITYQKGTILNLPYEDKQFDIVVCTHTLEHIRDIDAALKELRRITKKDLIIAVPRQRAYKYTFDLHIHFFPYLFDLKRLINSSNADYHEFGGDFVCVINLST